MEIDYRRGPFLFSVAVLCLPRRFTTINGCIMNTLKLMLTLLLISSDRFDVVLTCIYSYADCFLCFFLTIITAKCRTFLQ